jgi:hypothetical protein
MIIDFPFMSSLNNRLTHTVIIQRAHININIESKKQKKTNTIDDIDQTKKIKKENKDQMLLCDFENI